MANYLADAFVGPDYQYVAGAHLADSGGGWQIFSGGDFVIEGNAARAAESYGCIIVNSTPPATDEHYIVYRARLRSFNYYSGFVFRANPSNGDRYLFYFDPGRDRFCFDVTVGGSNTYMGATNPLGIVADTWYDFKVECLNATKKLFWKLATDPDANYVEIYSSTDNSLTGMGLSGIYGNTSSPTEGMHFDSISGYDNSTAAPPNAAPTNLILTPISDSQVTLTWQDNATNEVGYKIYQAPDNAGVPGTSVMVQSLPANSTSVTISGLTASTSYWFYVAAFNAGGEVSGNQIKTTTLARGPNAPTGLTATVLNDTSIRVDWTDNSTDETGFGIESSRAGQNSWTTYSVGAGIVTYTVTGLNPGTAYDFRVRALKAGASNSSYAGPVTATTNVTPSAAITLGALSLTAGYNTVWIELPFTGDDNQNASASFEYKKTADSTWNPYGVPLWPVYNPLSYGGGRAWYSEAALFDSGTSYDIRVTVTDPDGVNGSATVTGTIVTRVDNITPAASVVPTHYVRTDGSNSNTGTTNSAGGAYQTLEYARTHAGPNAIIGIVGGHYSGFGGPLTSPQHYIALTQCLDDSGNIINAGSHVIIEPGSNNVPNGAAPSGDAVYPVAQRGPWTAITPDGDGTHVIYQWQSPTMGANPSQLAWHTTRDGIAQRMATAKQSWCTSPADFATKIYTDSDIHWGAWSDGSSLYVRMPSFASAGTNPNSYYWTGSGSIPAIISGDNIRFTGLHFRCYYYGTLVNAPSNNFIYDHCINEISFAGIQYTSVQRTSYTGLNSYSTYPTMQYSMFWDSNLWRLDKLGISWNSIKSGLTVYKDSCETTAVSHRGGAKYATFRHNVVDGCFNGYGVYHAGTNGDPNATPPTGDGSTVFDRYSTYGCELYYNTLRNIPDDGWEPELCCIGWTAVGNTVDDIFSVVSVGPLHMGQMQMIGQRSNRMGTQGAANLGGGGLGVKYSGSSLPPGQLVMINCTFWTDQSGPGDVSGMAQYAGGAPNQEYFFLRNTIFRTTRHAAQAPGWPRWNEEYDDFATSDTQQSPQRGLQYGGISYTTNVTAYKTAASTSPAPATNGQHTNDGGHFRDYAAIDAGFTNTAAGVLTPVPGGRFAGTGVYVPGISNSPTPDRGYTGVKTIGAAPPVDTTAPTFASGTLAADGRTLTLSFNETGVLAPSNPTGFVIRVNAVQVTTTSVLASGTTVTVTLASAALAGQPVTVQYTPGNLADNSGNAVLAFGPTAVTNNSTQTLKTISPTGIPSAEAFGVPVIIIHTVPGVTAGPTLVARNPTTLEFAATINAAGYMQIEYGTTPSRGTFSNTVGPVTTGNIIIGDDETPLLTNTAYYIRLWVRNQYGDNTYADYPGTASTNAAGDVTPPVLSVLPADNISEYTARLVATTNEAAETYWEYGLTTSYGSNTGWVGSGTSHAVQLPSNLFPDTVYNFRGRARDAALNVSAFSANYTFKTAPAPAQPLPPDPTTLMPLPCVATFAHEDRLMYIKPDGVRYLLHAPPSRMVVAQEGFGVPPLEYVVDRAPFQHGDTVRAFYLKPRPVQIVVMFNFTSRAAYWTGRHDLINAIRPNRIIDYNNPGKLLYRFANGQVRQLDVMLDSGPGFSPPEGGWREWSFTEALRFTAHSPAWYDPTPNRALFAASVIPTFPITFPTVLTAFGGYVDLVYTGTWLEYPTFVVTGPVTGLTIENNTTGDKIELLYVLPEGRSIVINLQGEKRVVLDDGTNLMNYLSNESDLATFSLVPDPQAPGGVNTIHVGGSGTTGATTVQCDWYTRYLGI